MENQLAKDAARARFPYAHGWLGVIGSLILAAVTYSSISSLEAGEVESVSLWRPIAFLYETGGFWPAMLPFFAIAVMSAVATLRYRRIYLELRRQVPDSEFKSALRDIEERNAENRHFVGGKKTSAKQFLTVLIIGIVIAAAFFAWLINSM